MPRNQTTPAYLAILLLLGTGAASAASDKATLGSIKPIGSSTEVSSSCLRVYNTAVPGCSSSDFLPGSTCSGDCLRGLDMVQSNLQRSCPDVTPSYSTLLGQALLGNLVEVLCSENFNKPSTTLAGVTTATQEQSDPTSATEDELSLTTINRTGGNNGASF
jgi:hypothetical protein